MSLSDKTKRPLPAGDLATVPKWMVPLLPPVPQHSQHSQHRSTESSQRARRAPRRCSLLLVAPLSSLLSSLGAWCRWVGVVGRARPPSCASSGQTPQHAVLWRGSVFASPPSSASISIRSPVVLFSHLISHHSRLPPRHNYALPPCAICSHWLSLAACTALPGNASIRSSHHRSGIASIPAPLAVCVASLGVPVGLLSSPRWVVVVVCCCWPPFLLPRAIRSSASARVAVRLPWYTPPAFAFASSACWCRIILRCFRTASRHNICPRTHSHRHVFCTAPHRIAWQRVHPIFAPSLWHCKHSCAACRLRCVSWRSCWSALLASVGGGGGVLLLAALPSAACDQVVCKRESRCSTAVIHSTSITSIRIRIVSMLVPHGLPYDCHSRLATHATTVPTMPPHHHAKLASSLLLCFLSLSLSLSFSLAHAMAPSPSPPSVLVHLYLLHRTARQCISGHRLLFVAMHT